MFLPLGDNIHKRHFPYITVSIIVINVLVFALEANVLYQPIDEANPEAYEQAVVTMFQTWGLVPARDLAPNITNPLSHVGVFTHMFVHGDFLHLLGNMVVLWAFGYSLEGAYGSKVLATLYLAWGACAAFGHVAANIHDPMPMVGASGAIAGLIGAYTLTFGYNTSINTMIMFGFRPVFVANPARIFGAIWILMQIANAPMGDVG
ncbi:MAG: rhomboid family intramembrane serine protease, partial [Planctomycetales bacterium]|nr:rhomboid family intramembrane serine protease [Planctomycetales bacterium]